MKIRGQAMVEFIIIIPFLLMFSSTIYIFYKSADLKFKSLLCSRNYIVYGKDRINIKLRELRQRSIKKSYGISEYFGYEKGRIESGYKGIF